MKVSLVTFATPDMSKALALCVSSALRHGVTQTHPFDPSMLPAWYEESWKQERGFGCWRWKPIVIDIAMRACEENSVLVYMDAGVQTINNLRYVIDRMKTGEDVWLYGNEWEHYQWCKRDIIEAIWPLGPTTITFTGKSADGLSSAELAAAVKNGLDAFPREAAVWKRFDKQAQASVIFFRVNDYTRAFVAEWLKWCLTKVPDPQGIEPDRYLIDDSPSFAPNHPQFRENRHDQSIISTMAARDGIKLHGWFVRYETYEPAHVGYPDEGIPTLFLHHRKRNAEWK